LAGGQKGGALAPLADDGRWCVTTGYRE